MTEVFPVYNVYREKSRSLSGKKGLVYAPKGLLVAPVVNYPLLWCKNRY